MKNKLVDLNNHLFEQLERLNDEELIGEKLDSEIRRSLAVARVANAITQNSSLFLSAQKLAIEYHGKFEVPDILQIDVKPGGN